MEDVINNKVCNKKKTQFLPRLTAVERKCLLAGVVLGIRFHGSWVTAVIGLCETKASNQLARCKPGDVLFPLLLCAVGIDWPHDEAGLNAHGRSVAAVHSGTRGKYLHT